MRKISSEGLALIKQWEGLRLNAYKDAIGVWTIGYGHTNSAGKPLVYEGMTITEKQAEKLLCKDLRQFENAVERAVTVPLTDEQFAALVSFCYNVGTTAFSNSTLLKKLNKGEYEAVPSELQKWTKAGGKRLHGLVHRRAAEAGLWAKGAYVSSNYQIVEMQEPTKFLKAEILAPIIASFSGIAELLEESGPTQWVLATIIVLASCVGLILIAKRLREERL
ncbi:lysozyme [Bartonella sp. 1-1C]|uniref:lysozyme n=1 Tax=Bartonella sp. 1-1C TaxID=515256 RepID=UPI0001F4BBF6|nr:lysozyme [Bartonella sp. 1-1C]ATO57110.1 lysozyme [Bartonella sp. 1-1C]CBI81108.1 phage-related lysozyme [Bartonella sp. 1-1C]